MSELKLSVCPICGSKISYLEKRKIGNRVYLYSVHVKREKGKRIIKKCYLGKETKYLHLLEKPIPEIEQIKISKSELNDILLYYDKRDTKGMTKERRDKAKEIFRKVFSPGKRILEVEE